MTPKLKYYIVKQLLEKAEIKLNDSSLLETLKELGVTGKDLNSADDINLSHFFNKEMYNSAKYLIETNIDLEKPVKVLIDNHVYTTNAFGHSLLHGNEKAYNLLLNTGIDTFDKGNLLNETIKIITNDITTNKKPNGTMLKDNEVSDKMFLLNQYMSTLIKEYPATRLDENMTLRVRKNYDYLQEQLHLLQGKRSYLATPIHNTQQYIEAHEQAYNINITK